MPSPFPSPPGEGGATSFLGRVPRSDGGGHPLRPLLLLLVVLALVPMGAAQEHGHGASSKGMAMVLHDGPADGRAVVGGLTHLGFALLDAEGRLVAHQDAEIVVLQGDDIVFSSASAHEYDGLFSLDLTFTRPGPYQVVATSGEMAMTVFEGEAVLPANVTGARVEFVPAPAGTASNAVAGVLGIVDDAGRILPHTDALLEFRTRADERLVARLHTHIHEQPIAFTQALGLPGDYLLRVTAYLAYPTGRAPDVPAVVAEFPLTAGAAGLPGVPAPGAAADPLAPRGATASADGFTLQGMYDPQPLVGVGNPFRLSALVTEDESASPKAHVDFELEVRGPRGVVFSSTSLHEYDGMFEYAYAPDAPGAYDATLTAIVGETRLTIPYHVQVVPPVLPLGAGPKTVEVEGLDSLVAGIPSELAFRIAGPDGPLAHSEVDVTVARAGAAPLYQFKLHGHGDGLSRALLLFPEEGEWIVTVDPTPLEPQPALVFGPAGPGAPVVFKAVVAPALAVSGSEGVAPAATGPLAVPGPALGILLGTLAMLAALRRAPPGPG